jgi:hypothetical protein
MQAKDKRQIEAVEMNNTCLQSFFQPIKHFLQYAKIVQLFFNNHAKSQATIIVMKIELLLHGNL